LLYKMRWRAVCLCVHCILNKYIMLKMCFHRVSAYWRIFASLESYIFIYNMEMVEVIHNILYNHDVIYNEILLFYSIWTSDSQIQINVFNYKSQLSIEKRKRSPREACIGEVGNWNKISCHLIVGLHFVFRKSVNQQQLYIILYYIATFKSTTV